MVTTSDFDSENPGSIPGEAALVGPHPLPEFLIRVGDSRELLKTFPDQSVHCVVTSPPYYGLRDYGVVGQLGLEQTPELYVAELVVLFREVRRVLRDDGTLWLNLGDSYARSPAKGGSGPNGKNEDRWGYGEANARRVKDASSKQASQRHADIDGLRDVDFGALAPKQLLGVPWRVAFALQQDGWYLRQDIIWHKPNPMPESVRDRCTKAHEYLFLLSKSEKYYFDNEAIKEPCSPKTFTVKTTPRKGKGVESTGEKLNLWMENNGGRYNPPTANKRSVWSISSRPFKEAHFATFPPKLIEPCILAGCPIGGIVLDPFGGAGTTALVAKRNGRHAVLLELNPVYAAMAEKRIKENT